MTGLAVTAALAGIVGLLLIWRLDRTERSGRTHHTLGRSVVQTVASLLVAYAVVAALAVCGLLGGAFE